MSILIKGIDMPKKDSVMLWVLPNGIACVMDDSGCQYKVIEIPTPHGRLIDADALMSTIKEHDYLLYDRLTDTTKPGMFTFGVEYAVCTAPTIIEAGE